MGAVHEIKNTLIVSIYNGGEGGIRTPDRLTPMPHFECGAFNRSATSPSHDADSTRIVRRQAGAGVKAHCLAQPPVSSCLDAESKQYDSPNRHDGSRQ